MRQTAWAVMLAVLLGPAVAHAQQNLFNVPSAEITPKGALFFQQQLNVNKLTQTSTTIDYGFGNGYEAGLNIITVPLYDPYLGRAPSTSGQQQPDILLNGLKVFTMSERTRLGIGTQIGETAPLFQSQVQLANFTYSVGAFDLPAERGTIYAGGYFASKAYRGPGEPFGFLLGCDIPVVEKKVHFIADFVSGRSDLSVGVIGFVYYIPNTNWQVSAGAQLAAPRSQNPYGAVFELTYAPRGD